MVELLYEEMERENSCIFKLLIPNSYFVICNRMI